MTMGITVALTDRADALTAGDVVNKMNGDQRTSYVAGSVEAFAQARWIADKPDASGMQCIHSWFYGSSDEKWTRINAFFSRHVDKPAAALLYVLIKKECGE